MPNVTVKDIARRARVSIGTVDRVLHERGRAAKTTIAKVMKAAKEMDYQPNVFARNLSLAKQHHFGVVMPQASQNGGYWKLADRGLAAAKKKLAAFSVSIDAYRYDRYSRASFEKAFARAAAECPDGLLCAAVDPSSGLPAIRNIIARTPVVLFDSNIPGIEPLAFIGQESYQSGMLSGRLMAMCVPSGKILVVQAVADDFHIADRIRGFLDHFSARAGYDIVVHKARGATDDEIMIAELFSQHGDAAGMFISSADIHRYATSMEKNGGKRGRALIGYDLTDINRGHVMSGMIDFLIDQRPDVQVEEGLSILYRSVVLRQKPEKKSILMPLDIITKENAAFYRS